MSNVQFSKKGYWDERYAKEAESEWFGSYADFRHLLQPLLCPTDFILLLGCGNSSLSSSLFHNGFTSVVNLDYSEIVLSKMKDGRPEVDWLCADINHLPFRSSSFDVVIEKGTLDALLVGERSAWTLSDSAGCMLQSILTTVCQMLRVGGRFISITFAQPHFRVPVYAKTEYGWSVDVSTYGDQFHYFLYTMRKGGSIDLAELDRYLQITAASKPQTAQQTLESFDNEAYLFSITE